MDYRLAYIILSLVVVVFSFLSLILPNLGGRIGNVGQKENKSNPAISTASSVSMEAEKSS